MAVFQMLPKMIGSKKLFGRIALAKFVYTGEMVDTFFPIDRMVMKFFTAKATSIRRQVARVRERRRVKGGLIC